MGRESIAKYFNIPMREALRLEDSIHAYIRKSLYKDRALESLGEESIDPAEGTAMAREAYGNLFSEYLGGYLMNLSRAGDDCYI